MHIFVKKKCFFPCNMRGSFGIHRGINIRVLFVTGKVCGGIHMVSPNCQLDALSTLIYA